MSLLGLLNAWRSDPGIAPNIAAWRTFPARSARCVPFPQDLHPLLPRVLAEQGIQALYTHQAAAWQHVQTGRHPVVVTGTASGKTLCYNLPVLDRLLRDPQARALYLFPTKALAQDQAAGLRDLVVRLPGDSPRQAELYPAIYDGDTPAHQRSAIPARARLLFCRRKGLLMLVGGMKRDIGIHCRDATAKAFFRTVSVPFHEVLCFLLVDAKGAILEHPTAMKDAYEAGKRLVQS